MSKENQANYARIGFFTLVGIALVAGTLIWLGGVGSDKHEILAETYFLNPVSGLDVGSAVNFRGVRVGSVRRISFVGSEYRDLKPEDAQKIFVLMAFDTRQFRLGSRLSPEDTLARLVEKGLHATVSASGVTGLSRLELDFPKSKVEELKIGWKPRRTAIPPAPSILQSAADSATRILGQIDRMNLLDAWSNIVGTVQNANVLIGSLNSLMEGQNGNLMEISENLRATSGSLRDFADTIRSNPSLLLRSTETPPIPETR